MKHTTLLIGFISLIFNDSVSAQLVQDSASVIEYVDMSFEKLINTQVSVASKNPLAQRESPGVVTVVSENEIKNSGARDMIDILRLVPGFDFGTDVQGIVGLSMRGNWGHEGKIALIIDGQEMNELLFSTTYFGKRFDVSQIKRIEIIRGPGSSLYGGNAELGVINIITKDGEDLKSVQATATYGQLSDTYGRKNLSLAAGNKNGDFKWSAAGFIGQGQRTNLDYTDFRDSTASLKNKQILNDKSINIGLAYKGLSARWISEEYIAKTQIQFSPTLTPQAEVSFKMNLFELKYDAKLSKKLTITPKLNYTFQKPWNSSDPQNIYNFKISADKFTSGVHLNYDITNNLNFISGAEVFTEQAKYLNNDQLYFDNHTSNTVNYYTVSGYLQGLYKSKIAIITAGIKAIDHNKFGAAFAPRIGITKSYRKFHGKLLYNTAFRAPSIQNINYKPDIKPEITNVFEIEAGYKINNHHFITVNLFDIKINRPIIFTVDSLHVYGTYLNFDKSGTRGIETEYKVQYAKFTLGINYSYYRAKDNINAAPYQIPNNKNALLGIPNHKFGFIATYQVTKNFSVNPGATFMSSKYAVTGVDNTNGYIISEIDAKYLVNLNLRYQNLFVKHLECNLAVYDIFNQQVNYVQAYKGGLGPLPGTGTEVVLRLAYTLAFRNDQFTEQ